MEFLYPAGTVKPLFHFPLKLCSSCKTLFPWEYKMEFMAGSLQYEKRVFRTRVGKNQFQNFAVYASVSVLYPGNVPPFFQLDYVVLQIIKVNQVT